MFEFTKIHESIDKVASAIDEAINDVESTSRTEQKASANETIQAVKNGESIQLDASELAVSNFLGLIWNTNSIIQFLRSRYKIKWKNLKTEKKFYD